jgi:hypothetical protein
MAHPRQDEVIEALRRALEAHGVSPQCAAELATAHEQDAATEPRLRLHVVPVATGWSVISTIALGDTEVFGTQAAALARARERAEAESGSIVLHDGSGRSTTMAPR